MSWTQRLKAATAAWLRPHAAGTPPPESDFWYVPVGSGQNHAGVYVTPDIALKASALYAVVKVLAETIATMPLHMVRDLPDGGHEPAPDHPLDELIRFQPNSWQTAIEFWEMMMLHAVIRGTGYAEIVPGVRGAVDQLIPLHTDRVVTEVLPDRSLRFRVTNPHTGERRTLLQEEMFRVPGLSSDGVEGLRAVDLAAEDIGLGMAADAYAARMFQNNLNIGVALEHPGKLSPEAQKNLIQAFMEKLAGVVNSHRPMVLQEGMKANNFGQTADKAQLLEARKWQITLIAQRFRVPLHMLGIDDQTNRSTVEAQAIEFVRYTIRPWVRRIEQAIRRDLIIAKRTFSAKFNMDALQRGDSAARAQYFSAALGSGGSPAWMTQNEVRMIEGLNKINDSRADTLAVGTNPDTSAPPNTLALTDQSPKGKIERLVRKEAAAIRKAAMKYADDHAAFRNWVRAFYGGHISEAMRTLGVPKETARAYCDRVRDEVMMADDIGALLAKWQTERPEEIAKSIEAHAA